MLGYLCAPGLAFALRASGRNTLLHSPLAASAVHDFTHHWQQHMTSLTIDTPTHDFTHHWRNTWLHSPLAATHDFTHHWHTNT